MKQVGTRLEVANDAEAEGDRNADSATGLGSYKTIRLLFLLVSILLTGTAIWWVVHGIKQDFVVPATAIARERGTSYVAALPTTTYWVFENLTDGPGSIRSKTELFENDTPLGPAHSIHEAIRNTGKGRFSHWGSTLYFSASDNNDPRTNGRRYRAVITAHGPMWLLAVLASCLLISLYVNRRLWQSFIRWPSGMKGPSISFHQYRRIVSFLRRPAVQLLFPLFLMGSILLTGMAIWGVAHGIKRDFLIPPSAMASQGGASYVTALPTTTYWLFEDLTDGPGSIRSKTELFENDTPLGPAHSIHEAIRNTGKGRFSHWGSTLYFSTSDNSDASNNGRRYTAVITATSPMWLLAVLAPGLLISLYLNREIVNRFTETTKRLSARKVPVVLWKILPALFAGACLAWGVWVRVLFFRSFPDPLPTPDTWGYLTGTYSLLEKGQFDLFSLRTPGFPLLVWITLAVFKSFAALNVVQGALTLLSALVIGYVVRAFGGPWRLPAALAVSFVAVHPHLLYWEHFVMTEGSFHAFLVLGLGATALAILRPTPSRAAIAGVLTAITVLIRPQGMFLTALVLLALAWAGSSLGRRKVLWMLAAAGAGPLLLLGGWSARNAAVHGFFGLSNFGPLVNFGVAAPWIDLESPVLAEDKALIADSVRRYRPMPESLGWVMYSPDGPAVILAGKYGDPNRRDQVYNALAREAVLHHPLAFIGRGLSTTYKMLAHGAHHGGDDFAATARWDENWQDLAKYFPVNQHRAALNQTRFPLMERERIFTENIIPALGWETQFIRMSLNATLFALLALPLLRGPRRLATALAVVSVVLLIFTAGFFSEPAERYLSVIHGSAALAAALAVTGLLERWLSPQTAVSATCPAQPPAQTLR